MKKPCEDCEKRDPDTGKCPKHKAIDRRRAMYKSPWKKVGFNAHGIVR